jgi:predicted AAA+ superfamily ATPase
MYRVALQSLTTWKKSPSRKPLLVQGARQVGKTYLLRDFGHKEYENCVYYNFEETPALSTLFAGDLNPSKIIESLCAYQPASVNTETTLIFFDEIQACPRALTSLKYFCEQAPGYHIVAAGSLLGVSVGKTSSFPVGKVNFLSLYPLDFFEFMMAMDEESLLALLRENTKLAPITELLHEKLSDLFKRYLFLGGMPEVVRTYIETRDYSAARIVQKEILKAYERDFSKYTTPFQAVRVAEIWRSIPTHLARENKKFKYSDVKKNGRSTQFESAVEWLRSAGLIYTAANVTTAKLPLTGYADHVRFKAYLLDCGLLGAIIDVSAGTIVLGNNAFSEYNGAFIENVVATELARKNDGTLYYWISDGVAEVDFLVAHDHTIMPLEVKSGLSRNVKSLRVFAEKFHPPRIYRVSPRNFECRDDFVNFPLYAIGLFPEMFHTSESALRSD